MRSLDPTVQWDIVDQFQTLTKVRNRNTKKESALQKKQQ